MTTKYDALDKIAKEGMRAGSGVIVSGGELSDLIADVKALAEALERLQDAAEASDSNGYGTLSTRFVRDITRAALARIQGETG